MNKTVGSSAYGFTVTRVRRLPDGTGSLVEMVFDRTGTPLIWVDNGAENKLFSIAFRTLPADSTGVFHILEHTVLCGSGKYPVREPFVELIKSSVNTFLNAMTFPDKTVYPVSSRNTRDFLNLASVYLDAVFDPALLQNDCIFRQEGWHYEPDEDGLSCNGVVFNEMKGALSTADAVMEQAFEEALFPDTLYEFNSGGDPAHIPDLTYEAYTAAYRRYYHPSNAIITLDGAVPADDLLPLIASYLSRFGAGETFGIDAQEPVCSEKTVAFAASREDDPARDGQVWLGRVFASYDEKTKILAAQVLADALTGSNDAPLTRAVLSEDLAEDVVFSVTDGVLQPWFSVAARGIRPEKAEAFTQTVLRVARELAENGIGVKRLRASINSLAFRLREMPEPQGLIRSFSMLEMCLYGGDPLAALDYETCVGQLRAMTEDGGFERLLSELLLTGGLTVVTGVPSVTYEEDLQAAEDERFARVWESWDEEAREAARQDYEAFTAWQETEDTPEQLATLPSLSLSDIDPKAIRVPTEEKTAAGAEVLEHDLPSNGIVYVDAYFRLTDCPLEALPYTVFAASLLGQLGTEARPAEELDTDIRALLGTFSADISVHEPKGTNTDCIPMLTVQASMLRENLEEGLALVREILLTTDFTDTARIRENLTQEETGVRQSLVSGGHSLAITVTGAPYAASGAAADAAGGLAYVKRILAVSEGFEEEGKAAVAAAADRVKAAFTRRRLTLSVTGAKAEEVASFIEALPEGEEAPETVSYHMDLPARLAVRVPAPVGFAALGYHLSRTGEIYDGAMQVLQRIVSFDYLWNAVRVSGGAYGCGMGVRRGGRVFWYSYRDPSPEAALEAFAKTADFLRGYAGRGPDLTRYIISTTAGFDPLVSPHTAAGIADQMYFAGSTYEERCEILARILSASPEDLLNRCAFLEAAAAAGTRCIVAGADICDQLDDSWEVVAL